MLVGVSSGITLFLIGFFLLVDAYYEIVSLHTPISLTWWIPVVAVLICTLGFFAFRWGFRKAIVHTAV
jgi:hypothetical protein